MNASIENDIKELDKKISNEISKKLSDEITKKISDEITKKISGMSETLTELK